VHFGLGGGAFSAANVVPVNELWKAWPADVNGDGRPDLIVGRVSGLLDVLLQLPGGSFAAPSTFDVRAFSTRPADLAVADLNQDGVVDLVLANMGTDLVVLPGLGGGAFGAPRHFVVGNMASDVELADVDGDGRLDAVTANSVANTLSVLHGNGDGTFSPAQTLTVLPFSTNAAAVGLSLVDVDGDGQRDIVASWFRANALVAFLRQQGGWSGAVSLATRQGPTALAAGDFDRDGKVDLAASFEAANSVEVLLNRCN
jgi:hypothetical protein